MPPAFLTATVVTAGKCFGVVVLDNERERLVPASEDRIAELAATREDVAWAGTSF